MEVTDMSLDEIIEMKNIRRRPRNQSNAAGKPGNDGGRKASVPKAVAKKKHPKQVIDARDVICSRNRRKIADARERLNERLRTSDARVRLQNRAKKVARAATANGGGVGGRRHSVSIVMNRGMHHQGSKLQDLLSHRFDRNTRLMHLDIDDEIEHVELSKAERMLIAGKRKRPPLPIKPQAIKRTVHNEVFSPPTSMPPLPHFRSVRSHSDKPGPPSTLNWSDPFKFYDMRLFHPTSTVSMSNALPPFEPAAPTARPSRGILRKPSRSPPPSSHVLEHPQLSSSMRARLERAPNPSESMGIFAKMPPDDHPYPSSKTAQIKSSSSSVHTYRNYSPAPPSPPTVGYRIVVSNLHSNVIQEDIQELFEDIGDLIEARLVRPGIAEVIYRKLKDAENAVDAYHNRQLDGQPMNCLLVQPRASNKPTAPAMKYGR